MDIKEIELEKVNTFALRTIARQMGVKSPTSRNKPDLINEIKKAIDGKNDTKTKQSNKGRPCLITFDGDTIIDFDPTGIDKQYIENYTNKLDKIFDELIIKIEKIRKSYKNKILEISTVTKKHLPK